MAFTLAQFMSKATAVNPHISRIKESSLEPLLVVLRALPPVGAVTPQKKAEIQQAYAFIPFDKQTKYKNAFDYMKAEIAKFADAIPCKPLMTLHRFETNMGEYKGTNASGASKSILLNPRSFHHLCRFSYSSSNGQMTSLSAVGTREQVTYTTNPEAPPFNYVQAGTPVTFTQGATTNSGAQGGYCDDDHSTIVPALICAKPRVAGKLVAEQWYEYTTDGVNWAHIPQAAYLLEKSVKAGGPTGWLYTFKKSNWLPHNPNSWKLEIEYVVDPPPEYMPLAGAKISKSLNQLADLKNFAYKIVSLK
jgi:hypothetical protein